MYAFADPDTKRIPFSVFVNYLVISTKGSDEERAELTVSMIKSQKSLLQKSEVFHFLKKVFKVCKVDENHTKEITDWFNEVFKEKVTTLDAPEDLSLGNFDVTIDQVRDTKVIIPDLPSEYIKEFPMRHPDRSRPEDASKSKSNKDGEVQAKPLRRTRRGSSIHLHEAPIQVEETKKTLEEKAEKFKEDLKEKAQDLRFELKEKAEEMKKDWAGFKQEVKDALKKNFKLGTSKVEDVDIVHKKSPEKDFDPKLVVIDENKVNSEGYTVIDAPKELNMDLPKPMVSEQDHEEQGELNSESKSELSMETPVKSLLEKQESKKKTPERSQSQMKKSLEHKEDQEDEDDVKDKTEQKPEHKLKKLLNDQKDWLRQELNEIKGIRDVSRAELADRGQFFSPLTTCFGLFEKTSSFVSELRNLNLWDMSNVRFNLGKPVLSGIIKGDYQGYAKIESGFMAIYVGKKTEWELNGCEPNLVLNLREAIVKDKKYYRHHSGFTHHRKMISLQDEEESEISIVINKSDYHFTIENDSHNKWIWALRLNSGFHFERNDSFAPVRKHVACRFLHCGEQYYDELYHCLTQAKSQIFICGWMLSPKYFLQRNPNRQNLDDVLLERAKAGVKVHLLLWKDPGMIIDNGSAECEIHFNNLKSENIQVIRDPPSFGLVIWSHHQKIVVIDQDIGFVGGIDIAYNRYEIPGEYPLYDVEEEYFPGMDYVNPLIRQKNTGDYKQSLYDRTWEPRMPWNDIHCKLVGGTARDIAVNFIERWNFAVLGSKSDFKTMKSFLVPSTSTFVQSNTEPFPNCKVQALRSVSSWGFGFEVAETSIYNAYIDLIEKARHFIYIENQFFISGATKTQEYPHNKILMALLTKLRHAIKKKEDFKVIVMIPIQTASPIADTTTQLIMYWQFQTIYRGESSLYGILEKEFPKLDISQYIYFTSMRKHQRMPKDPDQAVTEIVYVHSKCMIVDDRYVIIGSANINDRSLSEGRDSEIAVLIEDTEKIEIKMGGQPFLARKFAHYLRLNLWRAYLRTDDSFVDPIAFFDNWVEISENNNKIFDHVFTKTHSTVKKLQDVKYLTEYNQNIQAKDLDMLKNIVGYIVPFPRDFLIDMPKPKSLGVNESKENLFYM